MPFWKARYTFPIAPMPTSWRSSMCPLISRGPTYASVAAAAAIAPGVVVSGAPSKEQKSASAG